MRKEALKAIALLRRHPAGLLLAAQLLAVVLYPVLEDSSNGHAIFGTVGILVLALALVLWVINRSPAINRLAC